MHGDGVLISEHAAHPYPANDRACVYDIEDRRDKRRSANNHFIFCLRLSNDEIRLVERIPRTATGGVLPERVSPANDAFLIPHCAAATGRSPVNLTGEFGARADPLLVRSDRSGSVAPHR